VGASSPFGVKLESANIPCFGFETTLPQSPGNPCGGQSIGTYRQDITQPGSDALVVPINIKAKVIHPYMHIFGLTGNYFEGDYLQTVLRFETAYVMGEPFQTTDKSKLVPVTLKGAPTGNLAPLGLTKRDIFSGM